MAVNAHRTHPLASNARTLAVTLAIAPLLAPALRTRYSLPSTSLSLLYVAAALQADKAGRFTVDELLPYSTANERKARSLVNSLAAAGYVRRVGSHTTYSLQTWQLTPEGWAVVRDATQRATSLLSPLLNRE